MVYTPNVYTSYDKSKTFEENKANGAVIEADKMNVLEQQVSKNADDIDSLSSDVNTQVTELKEDLNSLKEELNTRIDALIAERG